jgi:hypothetical protein
MRLFGDLTCWFYHVDAKHRPQGMIGSDVAGVGNATTGTVTDKLTREHRMTLDEAHLILNAKRENGIDRILQVRPLFYCLFLSRRASECKVFLLTVPRGAPLFLIRTTNTYSR